MTSDLSRFTHHLSICGTDLLRKKCVSVVFLGRKSADINFFQQPRHIFAQIPESFDDATMEIDYVRVYEQTGLGLSSIQLTEASMYPNPARDRVEVDLNSTERIKELSLYDITGKLVLHKNKIDLNKANLDISNLHSGLYIVAIKTNTSVLQKRLLVQ